MSKPVRILLQTTVPFFADGWHVGRFSLLGDQLARFGEVVARNRDPFGRPDSILSTLERSSFTQLWLLAVDEGNGLTAEDCQAIAKFRQKGGGLVVARDHMDLGSSVCMLGSVGAANHFHSKNLNPDPARRRADDTFTTDVLWPNLHSGANGDFQIITPVEPVHPVMRDPDAPGGILRYLPAHPHEGDISAPGGDPTARVIATGRSKVTGIPFNLVVAFEPSLANGPAIVQSTFHHFADCNWDLSLGAPSFVTEPPGDGIKDSPEARRAVRRYVSNLASWLSTGKTAHRESRKEHLDHALDEALDESFPASDPPAVD
jgi:hypothetical protein